MEVQRQERELGVFFDGTQIDQEPTDGWSYDSGLNRIEFHGAACAQLTAGDVNDLQVIFGCPDDILVE